MNYTEARIVLFPFQFGLTPIGKKFKPARLFAPPYVLNKIKVFTDGDPVTFRYQGEKKDLHLLQFIPDHYHEQIMEKDMTWKDPLKCFTEDIEILMEINDPIIWIFVNPKDTQRLKADLIQISSKVCIYPN